MHALVHSQLDYCNSVLTRLPWSLVQQLQSVLNSAAHLIFGLKRFDHITPALMDLHWLPCPQRITYKLNWLNMDERISFKIALLAYKSIHRLAPTYLSTYCIPVSSLPGRSHLRSAGEWKMLVPRTKTVTLGPRGFFWACPSTWNALPVPLRDYELSLDSFKRKLKSHFFTS